MTKRAIPWLMVYLCFSPSAPRAPSRDCPRPLAPHVLSPATWHVPSASQASEAAWYLPGADRRAHNHFTHHRPAQSIAKQAPSIEIHIQQTPPCHARPP
ncbi:hypothetical protein EJ06DRAFT_415441 [Trichodelitschia bisporula]|uniref:Uncharacterized protein n=1 Tax=Trichodelitschia bisporula TaxID=703511 RepID=A0A6G1HYN4_9PEZI|nr:hypothetical protein EJ06DRAFT_415441 [Trichodelitschia bisporula]